MVREDEGCGGQEVESEGNVTYCPGTYGMEHLGIRTDDPRVVCDGCRAVVYVMSRHGFPLKWFAEGKGPPGWACTRAPERHDRCPACRGETPCPRCSKRKIARGRDVCQRCFHRANPMNGPKHEPTCETCCDSGIARRFGCDIPGCVHVEFCGCEMGFTTRLRWIREARP